MEAVKQFIFTHATEIGCVSGGLVGAYYAGKESRKSEYVGQKVSNSALNIMCGAAIGGTLVTISPYMIVIVPACVLAHKAGETMSESEKQLQ